MRPLLVLVGLVAVLVGVLVYIDGVPYGPNDFASESRPASGESITSTYVRTIEWVPINHKFYEAWLYMPVDKETNAPPSTKPPVIIMGLGMGTQKDFLGIKTYAERFVAEGWAVFLFDYRHYGNSQGSPRNLIDPIGQVEDFHAAVVHLVNTKLTDQVDVTRIGLWGSSFSGGHVLVTASEWAFAVRSFPLNYLLNHRPEVVNKTALPELKAVVAQVPHLDPNAVIPTLDFVLALRGFVLAVADWFGSWFGLTVYIRIYGTPSQVAILNTVEGPEYGRLIPEYLAGGWVNKAPARSVLYIARYRPLDYVAGITAPTLVLAAKRDTLCPISAVDDAQKLFTNNPTIVKYDAGHFELYEGHPLFEEAIAEQIRFYHKHL